VKLLLNLLLARICALSIKEYLTINVSKTTCALKYQYGDWQVKCSWWKLSADKEFTSLFQ